MTTLTPDTSVTTGAGRRTVRTMCPMNCHPTYCGMLVEIEDDRVVGVRGDKDNPDSQGFLCIRGQAAGEIVDNPLRLLRPRLRDRRAADAWRDTSWDEALDRVAAAIRAAGREHVAVWGGHGVFLMGIHGPLLRRFANLGGYQWWNPSIVCWGLGGLGLWLTGPNEVHTKEDLAAHSDLILLWGANLASQPGTAPHLVAAKRRGAHVVAIDVRRTEAFEQADESYLIRPGTDAALALALLHVIIGEGLHDPAFVAEHTVGFEELADHVRQYTPEWAAEETGIAAEAIRSLAHRYAATRRAQILLGGSSMHKTGNGWQAGRAVACLPALTGALGQPGGGFGPRHAAASHGAGFGNIMALDGRPDDGPMVSEMSTILDQIEAGEIKVLLLFGTNMLSSFADTARLARALERVECVVLLDLFANETSRGHADVVLPGTSWLEESGFKATNTNLYLMDQALEPRGETRSSADVLRALADRLDLPDFFPWSSVDDLLDMLFDHPATGHVSAAEARARDGRVALNVSPVAHPDHRYATPSGKIEFRSERAQALGLPALPVYEPPAEDARRDPARAARYPLWLRTGRTLTHFHGFYDHGQALPSLAKADPSPRLWLNPADAAARGLSDGAAIRLFNDRGEMRASAQVTERVPAGVTWMHDGWAGLNHLTSGARVVPDAAAEAFPSGAAAYEARIEVVGTPA